MTLSATDTPKRFVHPWSVAALVVLTLAAVAPWIGELEPTVAVLLLGVSALFLAATTLGAYLAERRGSARAFAALFATQLSLAAAVVYISRASASLVVLAVISEAVLYLRPVRAASVVALALTTAWSAILIYAPDTPSALRAIAPFAAAATFVIAFSWMARAREAERAQAALLARQLTDAQARVAELAAERERTRIAREMHDTVGHCLTAAHVQMEATRLLIAREPERALEALGHAAELVREGLAELRRSVALLRMPDPPLTVRIERLLDGARRTGLSVELRVEGATRSLDESVELTLLRVAQEAMTNVLRHAQATRAEVVLRFAEGAVSLVVHDDGVGASLPGAGQGFGLRGMRERVEALGGQLSFVTSAGAGMRVHAELPA